MWLAYKAVKSLAASKAVSTVSNNVSNKSAPNTSSKLGKLKDKLSSINNTKLYGNCGDILLDTYETSNKFIENIPTGVFIAFLIISIIFIIILGIANTSLREYIEMIPSADDVVAYVGDGWWDVDFFPNCEERFAKPTCLYGNDLSLWTGGYERYIKSNDNEGYLSKCASVGQLEQPSWWWQADEDFEDDTWENGSRHFRCGNLDQLDEDGVSRYCSPNTGYIDSVITLAMENKVNTNAPRKYLECLYLNEKKCYPEEGDRLPFLNVNDNLQSAAAEVADFFTPDILDLSVEGSRRQRCIIDAGGLLHEKLKRQAKNSIRYRIYKESGDINNLSNIQPSSCRSEETLEAEANSLSEGNCFGKFKPNCSKACPGSDNSVFDGAKLVLTVIYFVILVFYILCIIYTFLYIYYKIITSFPSLKCDD